MVQSEALEIDLLHWTLFRISLVCASVLEIISDELLMNGFVAPRMLLRALKAREFDSQNTGKSKSKKILQGMAQSA